MTILLSVDLGVQKRVWDELGYSKSVFKIIFWGEILMQDMDRIDHSAKDLRGLGWKVKYLRYGCYFNLV